MKRIMRKINLASREVADESKKNAAKEEVSASGRKVIDVAVLSSYCKGCEKWRGPNLDIHMKSGSETSATLIKNHGSSSKMSRRDEGNISKIGATTKCEEIY
ncbi:hypothetical protein TNCV_4940601 [Trichonephila clavipes]|nr:hypothetical protein TNCV_4940601 [Trichonephila clavipes]